MGLVAQLNARRAAKQERGAVTAVLAICIGAMLLLTFFSLQYAVNTIENLAMQRVAVSMLQQMQGRFASKDAYVAGAVVAELNGFPDVEPAGGPQDLTNGVRVNMAFDPGPRPPVASVELDRVDNFFADLMGALRGQRHAVTLRASSSETLVVTMLDNSASMRGPYEGSDIDDLLTAFDIPLDPNRNSPNLADRDLFSPIDSSVGPSSDRVYNGNYYRLRLGFLHGMKATPNVNNPSFEKLDALSQPRSNFQDPDGIPSAPGSSPAKLVCDPVQFWHTSAPTQHEPGYRISVPLPTKSDPNQRLKLSLDDTCLAPWLLTTMNDLNDPTTGFLTAQEALACSSRGAAAGTPALPPEIPYPGCSSHRGSLPTDFLREYRDDTSRFLLDLERFTRLVIGVFAASSPHGRIEVVNAGATGLVPATTILWDATKPQYFDKRLYEEGINLADLVWADVAGLKVLRAQMPYYPLYSRQSLMLGLMPESDPRYPADVIDSSGKKLPAIFKQSPGAYVGYRRAYAPVEDPDRPYTNPYGGYNSFSLSGTEHPSSLLNMVFTWLPWGDISPNPNLNPRPILPSYQDQDNRPYVPPAANIDSSWNYTLPKFQDINPEDGSPLGGEYQKVETKDYALGVWKDLALSAGGSDVLSAVTEMVAAWGRDSSSKAVGVLITDGAPTAGCVASVIDPPPPAIDPLPNVRCRALDDAEHLTQIHATLRSGEENKKSLFIVLLMVPRGTVIPEGGSGVPSNQAIQNFVNSIRNNAQPDSDSRRIIYVLDYGSRAEFTRRVRYFYGAILLAIRSFATYAP